MSKGLISLKDEFNGLKLETANISQYMAYYALLLTTACEYGLISKFEADNISKEILENFNKFNYSSIVMANNMYVLTTFLRSMQNTEQLEILMKVSASKLFDEANNYFSKRIYKMQSELSKIDELVIRLKEESITNSYKYLMEYLKELLSYSAKSTKCNLKVLHKSAVIIQYPCLEKGNNGIKENILDTTEEVISNFVTEINILAKLYPEEMINRIKTLGKANLNSVLKEIAEKKAVLENEIENLKINFKKQKEIAEKKADMAEEKFEILQRKDRREFKKMNPKLKGDDFECAFEEWQESLPDEHFEGIYFDLTEELDRIHLKFCRKNAILEENLSKLEEDLQEKYLEAENENDIEISLSTVLKLIAIFEASKMDLTKIPKNIKELNEMLDKLESKSAAYMLISMKTPNLSEDEISYLEGK